MGMFLNPGNENFRQALRSKIYVDKTLVIKEFNNLLDTNDKFVCMSRARRFGKTMLQCLVSAYYSKGCDSREIFSNLKISTELTDPDDIEKYQKNLNAFNVIHLDFNGFNAMLVQKENFFEKLHSSVREEFLEQFPDIDFDQCITISDCIKKVYKETNQKFIIIIDEYDFFVRYQVDKDTFENFLKLLISLFKNTTLAPAISLAYLTGILPIVRDKIQSKLNTFKEYTMLNAKPFEKYIGFTKDEVKALCKEYKMSANGMRHWYDGYKINNESLYNSNSVVNALLREEFGSYWGQTGSYEAVSDYIKFDFFGIQEDVAKLIGGQEVKVDVTTYLNTLDDFKSKDDVFTYLIHLGYLTYVPQNKTCKIPNYEVNSQWGKALIGLPQYSETHKIIKESEDLLEAVIKCDSSLVADSLKRSHSLVMSNLQYNNEACFASAIMLSFIAARDYYTVFMELPTGDGFADVVLIPYKCKKPALVIELKIDTVAETAINQIYTKKYGFNLEKYRGNTRFIGISYNKESKDHFCKIEKW